MKQDGAVLLVALIFLAALAMISVTVMQSSTLELRMAGNEQEQMATLQSVEAILDQISRDDDYFPVIQEGYLVCMVGDTRPECDTTSIDLSTELDNLLIGNTVTYQTYYRLDSTMPRASQSSGTVYDTNYRVAYFDVDVTYDSGDDRGSDRDVSQGVQSIYRDLSQSTQSPEGVNADTEMQSPVTP